MVRTRSTFPVFVPPIVVDWLAVSFAGVESPTPLTVAVLMTVPLVASAGTDTCTVIVHVAFASRDGSVHETRFPVFAQVPCDDETPVTVRAEGTGSVTVTTVAASGPAFDTTIVYENVPPGATVSAESVFVIDRSAESGVTVSVSVATPLAGLGSGIGEVEIVAVFTRVVPTNVKGTATVSCQVIDAPDGARPMWCT